MTYDQWEAGLEDHWTTKDGRRILISQMSNQHLVNTIKLLRRVTISSLQSEIRAAEGCLSMLQGEYATYYCEQDIGQLYAALHEAESNIHEYLLEHCAPYPKMMEQFILRNIPEDALNPDHAWNVGDVIIRLPSHK